ncbi:MAG: tetratricopeptide repeat protein [Deltaproteobacteria bacterium]|nr:tetratricopeptide repeat protein [Deltaproteobacteria bacterium]
MLEERLDRLEVDKKDLEQDLKKQKSRLDEQVAAVQSALQKLEKTAHRTGADIGVQVEQIQADLSQLRGQVEQYQHQIGELQSVLDKLKAAPGPAAVAATGGTSGATEPGETRKPDPPAEKPKPAEKPTDKKGFAELTLQKLADEPKVGRELAGEFLKKWPKDSLAAKVHLELGASYMAQKDWRAALAEFGEIVKNFGKSEQAPDALLKSSDCFASLKMNDEARLALEEILNSHPKSESAKLAKTKLAELKKAKPASAPKKK